MSQGIDHWERFDERASASGDPASIDPYVLLQLFNSALEAVAAQQRRCLTVNAHERLALMHLWVAGSITMSELGDRIPLSRAAVTALTDRLERMGYVVRTPDEHDRRRTLLSMTRRPSAIVAPVATPLVEQVRELVAGMEPQEWEIISTFIDRVRAMSLEHADELRALTDDELHELVDEGQRRA